VTDESLRARARTEYGRLPAEDRRHAIPDEIAGESPITPRSHKILPLAGKAAVYCVPADPLEVTASTTFARLRQAVEVAVRPELS
jgi:hypothetical protein